MAILFFFFQTVNADNQGCCSYNVGLNYCQANQVWMCDNQQESPTCRCDFYSELSLAKGRLKYLEEWGRTEMVHNETKIKDAREKFNYTYVPTLGEKKSISVNKQEQAEIKYLIKKMEESLQEFLEENPKMYRLIGVDGLRCSDEKILSKNRLKCERIPRCPTRSSYSKKDGGCICEEGFQMRGSYCFKVVGDSREEEKERREKIFLEHMFSESIHVPECNNKSVLQNKGTYDAPKYECVSVPPNSHKLANEKETVNGFFQWECNEGYDMKYVPMQRGTGKWYQCVPEGMGVYEYNSQNFGEFLKETLFDDEKAHKKLLPLPIPSKIPNSVVICNDGFSLSLNKKYCVEIPINAHVVESDTDVWVCNEGFFEQGSECLKQEVKEEVVKNNEPLVQKEEKIVQTDLPVKKEETTNKEVQEPKGGGRESIKNRIFDWINSFLK